MVTFRVKAILLFLFAPERFNRAAVEYHKSKKSGHPVQFDEAQFAKDNLEQAAAMRRGFIGTFSVVLVALLAALVLGMLAQRYIGPPSGRATMGLQLIGAFMLLGATLWRIAPEAESASRAWLAEHLHNWLFKSLYVVGTFLLGLAASWDGFAK
jgi:small-conductance mechanosensitive channel